MKSPKDVVKFGFKNYLNMYRSRGIYFAFNYFFNCHLFDILHRTDTHKWLPKQFEEENLSNQEHGVGYMATGTNDIRKCFKIASKFLGDQFGNYDFLDLGSGKGKVVLVWTGLCKKSRNYGRVSGVEYSEVLSKIARKNYLRIFKSIPENTFVVEDVVHLDFSKFKRSLIIFCNNPFDDVVLKCALDNLRNSEVLLIYHNPIHTGCLLNNGWTIVHKESCKSYGIQGTTFFTNFQL